MNKIAQLVLGLACCYYVSLNAAPTQKSINFSIGLGAPITTATTDTMDKGGWGISQRTEYYPNQPLSNLELLQHPDAESQNVTIINFLMFSYGLGENLTLGASLPYIYTAKLRAATFDDAQDLQTVSTLGNISAISDATLFSLWRVFDKGEHPFSIAILSGINAPTGKSSERDNEGELFAASDQAGSGAWAPFGGLIFTKKWDEVLISTNLTYTPGIEGAQQTTVSSLFDVNVGLVFPIYEERHMKLHLDGVLELNGEYATRSTIAGFKDPHSGGTTLFVVPGFRLNIASAVSIYLGGDIPMWEHLNGVQVKNRWGAIGGIDINM
ncbi:hypothetical protein [uncultured Legionella sp.]|uniref:hypothetical protein n=1 Tax=uncultured Legionella sp. TaxID=210934 RepID=UPI002603478D|nr:hypothetical protein [uncultured Legionella sp.]